MSLKESLMLSKLVNFMKRKVMKTLSIFDFYHYTTNT